jgi:hypothetical protein
MNYLAHGWRFIDDAYFLAGTAVPDWLSVVDRRMRVRSTLAAEWVGHPDPVVSAIARGICQHHADDRWFHVSRAFAELSIDFSARARRALDGDESFRCWFLGHILVELLLDALLIEQDPDHASLYYAAMDRVDPLAVERAITTFTAHDANGLAAFIFLFCRERFLWDYLSDAKLMLRLNQVMRRARLAPLPASLIDLLPGMRADVRERRGQLFGPGFPSEGEY